MANCFAQSELPFRNVKLSNEERINDLLGRLTIEEKISLLITTSKGIDRLGVEKYYHGNEALHGVVRPGRFTVFPQAIALAATWNPKLIKNVATVISDEARAKWNFYNQGKEQKSYFSDVLTFWSPTVNMARDPRWGRTPETYGEDPLLTSRMGVAFVQGLQGEDKKYLKVVATLKHFAANNEDYNRFSCNAIVPERALREYYFKGFEAGVKEGKAQSIMSAYNAINGVPSTANKWLLNDVLRKEWGFNGYVVCDCGAINSLIWGHHFVDSKVTAAKAAIEAGVDLECGDDIYKNHLLTAYKEGMVTESAINQAAFRVLDSRFKLGIFDPIDNNPYTKIAPDVIGSSKHQSIALEAARESIVLLKNTNNVLPLNKNVKKKIAVLGPNASNIVFGDYSGKAVIKPVSVLDGIKAKAGNNIEIKHVNWKSASKEFVLIEPEFLSNDKSAEEGLYAEYFDNMELKGTPKTRTDKMVNYEAVSQPPDPVISDAPMSIRWTGYITPALSGTYKIKITSSDGNRFWLDNKLVVDQWRDRPEKSDLVECKMEAGKKYAVKLEYFVNRDDEICQLFWETPTVENSDKYAEDLKAARESDYVIAVLGINKLTEREGIDRKTIDLPLDQTNYLKEIYKENKNVIVVLIAGSSLAINWIDENIPAIVEGWYPGESGGTAIADVLFGDYNPGGRLPFTFYKSTDDLPAFDDYDIYKGRTYMYFDGKPLYPFGYGLSFTNFQYSKLSISNGGEKIVITADIKNTGKLNGDEVVQLYCTDVKSSVKRPIKQLVDFTRISLKAGETKRISLTVTKDQLKYWDVTTNRFVFESGEFAFTLGSSSQNERLKKVIEIK
jgi:beta-glucosidase